jgi:hypothetical protein
MRDTRNSAARLLVEGTRCPGRNWPLRMAWRNHSESWLYIGTSLLESSAMGGRKLGAIRFIEMRLKWPYRITTKWIL